MPLYRIKKNGKIHMNCRHDGQMRFSKSNGYLVIYCFESYYLSIKYRHISGNVFPRSIIIISYRLRYGSIRLLFLASREL